MARARAQQAAKEPTPPAGEERQGEERHDPSLEGLSGMGARIGRVSHDKDQVGHLERQGFRREEQQQIEASLEDEEARRVPDTAERLTEPHENKGITR